MVEIIAEIGISHGGDMNLLKKMIYSAKECGANIAKTQLYDPAKLFPSKQIWVEGTNWYSMVEKTKMSYEQLGQFFEWCKEADIEPMASAFDLERVGWLEDYGVRRHKVASPVNNDTELIEAFFRTNKDILVSCKRRHNVHAFWQPQNRLNRISWLYCIPEYPTFFDKLEFDQIGFPGEFQGFSDHTIGIEASIVAMSRGARIIEKHFTLDRKLPGPDMVCSIEPHELKELVEWSMKVEEIL